MKTFLAFLTTLVFSALTSSLHAQHQPNCLAPSKEPLIQAIRDGELERARKMIDSGTKLNVSDECGAVPLLEAIRFSDQDGYTKFVLELLSAGADPTHPDGGAEALAGAAFMCNTTIARELLKRGVSVNAANRNGLTALMEAPSQRCAGAMVQLLLEAGADPNATDKKGFNALLAAAMTGDAAGAERLLKAGADPAFKTSSGMSAESESCGRGEQGHYRVCQLVTEALRKK
jgi:ankyrin repeat protein